MLDTIHFDIYFCLWEREINCLKTIMEFDVDLDTSLLQGVLERLGFCGWGLVVRKFELTFHILLFYHFDASSMRFPTSNLPVSILHLS